MSYNLVEALRSTQTGRSSANDEDIDVTAALQSVIRTFLDAKKDSLS